jgi:hypothetical protein
MADVYGVNWTDTYINGNNSIVTTSGARVRVTTDTYTTDGTEVVGTEIMYGGLGIPKDAYLVGYLFVHDALGTGVFGSVVIQTPTGQLSGSGTFGVASAGHRGYPSSAWSTLTPMPYKLTIPPTKTTPGHFFKFQFNTVPTTVTASALTTMMAYWVLD